MAYNHNMKNNCLFPSLDLERCDILLLYLWCFRDLFTQFQNASLESGVLLIFSSALTDLRANFFPHISSWRAVVFGLRSAFNRKEWLLLMLFVAHLHYSCLLKWENIRFSSDFRQGEMASSSRGFLDAVKSNREIIWSTICLDILLFLSNWRKPELNERTGRGGAPC